MHPIRCTILTALAALTTLGVACSGGGTKNDATPTKAATTATTATATVTTAPATSTPTAAAATAVAKAAAPVSTPGADGTVKATISGFKLPTLTVKAGTVVVFVNEDGTAHTATSNDNTTFDSQTLAPSGGSFKFTAGKVGTFPYTCAIHPDMKGALTVQ